MTVHVPRYLPFPSEEKRRKPNNVARPPRTITSTFSSIETMKRMKRSFTETRTFWWRCTAACNGSRGRGGGRRCRIFWPCSMTAFRQVVFCCRKKKRLCTIRYSGGTVRCKVISLLFCVAHCGFRFRFFLLFVSACRCCRVAVCWFLVVSSRCQVRLGLVTIVLFGLFRF